MSRKNLWFSTFALLLLLTHLFCTDDAQRDYASLSRGLTSSDAGGQFHQGPNPVLVPPASNATDLISPKIDRITPHPGEWTVGTQGVSSIRIGFTEAIVIPQGSVLTWLDSGGGPIAFSTSFAAQSNELIVSLGSPVRDDRLTLTIDFTVTDLAGNPLDGEISEPSNPSLPSGDGRRGGQAVFQFHILKGDANRDGLTNALDRAVVQSALGSCNDDEGFLSDADINGDDCVNVLDAALVNLAQGNALPSTDGLAPEVVAITPSVYESLEADVGLVTLTFSEAIDPERFGVHTLSLVDSSGGLIVPVSGQLASDQLSASFGFAPSLTRCDTYQLVVSNSLADHSGELLRPGRSTHALSGFHSVAPPVVDALTGLTSDTSVVLTGSKPMGSTIEVSGPTGIVSDVTPGSLFAVNVTLAPNQINTLHVTAIDNCGARSTPVTVQLFQDNEKPFLFIDYPREGQDLSADTTDVTGRVGDMLSGFDALTVKVTVLVDSTPTDFPAAVNRGIGTNGTFFVSGVPLEVGAQSITVTATDSLGNSESKQITVTRTQIPAGTPSMSVVSGNGQTSSVGSWLAAPLVVHLARANGTPFVNKVVNFKVTRSDGRLSEQAVGGGALFFQSHTDSNGNAMAFWKLGFDAGQGNNRVEVTSQGLAGTVVFCASATPGPASQINVGTGNHQIAEVGGEASQPLRARVSDGCNGVSNVPVTFTVVAGDGRIDGQTSVTVPTSATGHAEVRLTLGPYPGNNVVEASFRGNTHAPAAFEAIGIVRDLTRDASFVGLVLDNSEQPLGGAVAELRVQGASIGSSISDSSGQFHIEGITQPGDGEFLVHAAGINVINGSPVPSGVRFPSMRYKVLIVPNAENSLPMPVLLPRLNTINDRVYDGTQTSDLTLTCADMEGFQMTVRAGTTVTLPGGTMVGPGNPGTVVLALNQVHHDDLPMPMPDGAASPFAWTLQPSGAFFDKPVEIEYPNMAGLPAGTVSNFLSFNHDTNRFEIVATGTVSEDGSIIRSDPGVGITHSGWGGNCPPYSITGGVNNGPNGELNEPPPGKGGSPLACEQHPLPSDSMGDPVFLFSGEFYLDETDFRIPGRGMDFIWARKYTSQRGGRTAIGNNWDYSYNIQLLQRGSALELREGTARKTLYVQLSNGKWSRDGFFRELTRNIDNTYTLLFADRTAWHFNQLGGPGGGRISRIVDRNGNTLIFDYDSMSRLVRIHDTLDSLSHTRDITLAYVTMTCDGETRSLIESVTDYAGRSVRYEYYGCAEAGGGFGDLKSVTSPMVSGTPNGNDYPQGKTTTYMYHSGFSGEQARLNSNLTTVRDGRGNIVLENVYGTALDTWTSRVTDGETFDKVIRQVWGGDTLEFFYRQSFGGAGFGSAAPPPIPNTGVPGSNFRTIVRDRVGNVREFFYDKDKRLVRSREFTGRANPSLRTTETENRPTGKLRAEDPDYFEHSYAWNSQSLMTRETHPNGTIIDYIYESDVNPAAPPRTRGNLRYRFHRPGTHTPAGDQLQILEAFTYDLDFNGCCGSNFLKTYTDGRGNTTTHDYDDNGNRIRTTHRISSIVEDWEYNSFGQMTSHTLPDNGSGHRRRDEYTYHATGPQNGYLKDIIYDAENFALTTTFQYDSVGNIVRHIDPRGHATDRVVNTLNQTVREIAREVTDGSATRYQKDFYYDANNNLVRVDVQNVDETGVVQPNTHLTTVHEYEVLNNLTRTCEEVGIYTGAIPGSVNSPTCLGLPASQFATTEYEYDKNRNRTRVRYGEAVENRQPTNTVHTLFDERDLSFRVIRAEGDAAQSTKQFDYDGNRNIIRESDGLESAPRVTTHTYDGYDRRFATTDPMGNVTSHHYDANGNRVSSKTDGQLVDVPGNTGNVRLSEVTYVYDNIDRQTHKRVAFFDVATGNPIAVGLAVTRTIYSANSQVLQTINDNNHASTTTYDTNNRRSVVTDAKGNTVTFGYDENSNVVTMTEVEESDLGGPNEVFVTTYAYDNLDRHITTTDNIGNINRNFYDSRDNRVKTVDALGNVVLYLYDGLSRMTATVRDMTDTGDGSGSVVDTITTSQSWDDSSRLTGQTDDNGNTTAYGYDALNRRTTTTYADGTVHSTVFDVHDNAAITTDANGSVVTSTFDLADRLVAKSIAVGSGVSNDTTFENFQYDGRGRLVRAEDNDSVVSRDYDSLSRVTREIQNGQTVGTTYDGVGNMTLLAYPGGRLVTTTYDELERKKVISDQQGTIATYNYVGPNRVATKELGNGTLTKYEYDGITGVPNPPNDFGVKRITRTRHTVPGVSCTVDADCPSGNTCESATGTCIIDDRTYTWDRMFNKTQRKDVRPNGPRLTHDYSYDSIYRLIRSVQSDPGGVLQTIDYALDGVGNRTTVIGGPDAGVYTLNAALPEPGDFQLNQYTTTPEGPQGYDKNGNLVTMGVGLPNQRLLAYDYKNRMVSFDDPVNGVTAAYDALGRRISNNVDDGSPETIRFLLTGWQEIEEQNDVAVTVATYVFGNYIDEPISMRRSLIDYYYHADDHFNISAATTATSNATERYEYIAFGQPLFYNGTSVELTSSEIANPVLFTGRRYDQQMHTYYYRTRYLQSQIGQFATTDTIGSWGDPKNLGNARTFAGNNPATFIDPLGQDFEIQVWFGHLQFAIGQDGGTTTYVNYGPDWSEGKGINGPGLLTVGPEKLPLSFSIPLLSRVPLTPQQDQLLLDAFHYYEKNPPPYSLGPPFNFCWTVPIKIYNEALPLVLPPLRDPPRGSYIGPFGTIPVGPIGGPPPNS